MVRAVELFERHSQMVYRRCRELLGSDEAARDAVQDVFLRVVAHGGRFRHRSSPVTWLYAIATLHCLQQLRNSRRRSDHFARMTPQSALAPTVDDRLALETLLGLEDEAVQTMVILRHVDQVEVEEIARAIGCSRKTVARKLKRFLEDARRQLELEAGAP